MKIMVRIWGSGSYHNIGSINSEEELKELQQKIEDSDWDSSDYDDSCNGDVDMEFGIAPEEAMLTVFAMRGKKVTDEKLFECRLDELPYRCFSHEFQIDFPFQTPRPEHVWHFQQTVTDVFEWSDLSLKRGQSFDPKKLQIPVKHVLFKGEELYTRICEPIYTPLPDEDFGGLDEGKIRWSPYCQLKCV